MAEAAASQSDRDLASIAEARALARRAKQAWIELADFSQERIDAIVDAMAAAAVPQAEAFARLAVEETGYGVVEDKVQKNLFSAQKVYDFIRPMKTVGVIARHDDRRVIEIAEQELTARNSQEFAWLSLLVTSHHRSGQSAKRDERLKQLEAAAQTDTKALYALAENYAELGRTNDALAALEKCIEVREERMMWLKVEPRLAHLKGNARFDEILRRMNLAGV